MPHTHPRRRLWFASLALLLLACAEAQAQTTPLFELGRPGSGNTSFALAPAGWQQFDRDALFLVGHSSPATDWPYVHPGPGDNWAGRRVHTFRLIFDLATAPTDADGALVLGILDAHRHGPPTIEVSTNGVVVGRETPPKGGGDGSINGRLDGVVRHTLRLRVPAGTLRTGRNTIAITSVSGNWFLYEHLTLTMAGATLAPPAPTTVVGPATPIPGVVERDGRMWQPLSLDVLRTGERRPLVVQLDGAEIARHEAGHGRQDVEVLVPAAAAPREATVSVDGERFTVPLRPVRPITIYVVPHSHTDIGYTHLQQEVEHRQVENLSKGIALAEKTAAYPEGARFVWNVEVMWAADLFLQRMEEPQRAAFERAVKAGRVGLNGLYLNILTGLARPEELVQATRMATHLSARLGVPVDTAMISDIPGHTWGTVTALSQAGVRYFSTSPNFFDRIGTTQVASADQPFWWVGPSGRERVLTWNTWMGYALSHLWGATLTAAHVDEYLRHLDDVKYPYDITYIRWSGPGDNAEPEATICDFVKDWNARYRWPRFIISDQRAPFVALEQRYGDRLPVRRGDWTPYWEDGAGSSARETALNRASADRMTQAQVLWALRAPEAWPAAAASAAWKKVLLYTEHTWGGWNSVSAPEAPFVKDQWEVKRAYAEEADWRSRKLLADATPASSSPSSFDVINTLSWSRTDIVLVPPGLSVDGDRVLGADGRAVPSQRLTSGDLAVLIDDLPPFATRRYHVVSGKPAAPAGLKASASAARLSNGLMTASLDSSTGAVTELLSGRRPQNLVDTQTGHALNEYLFMAGDDPAKAVSNGRPRISVKERGPLVASVLVESDAPGAARLSREVTLTAGLDRLELRATIDKRRAPAGPRGDYYPPSSKESVNLAFPFNVPGGQIRLELPLGGVIRPDTDQIEGSCRNWFTIGNWADVSTAGQGVTWVSLDTPLVQLGGLTANLLNSQTDHRVWRTSVAPTQALFPWLMNNHWGTNYRAYQEGPVTFRFAVAGHQGYDAVRATHLGTGLTQPLLALPASGPAPSGHSRLTLSNRAVIVTGFKPADDGAAWIVRLYNLSDSDQQVSLGWDAPVPARTFLSGTSEARGDELRGPVTIPGWGLVTLRAER